MGILNDAFKRVSNKQFMIQSDVLLSNMLTILKSASGDVNDSTTLDIFLAVPFTFDNRDFDTSATIVFESAASKPNINWLIDANATTDENDPFAPVPLNSEVETYLDHILSIYNVSDKILLVSMIADAIDIDLDARNGISEIAAENVDFTQGYIYDYHHFRQVLEAYERVTLDSSVEHIPWESLIGFTNASLDFNHITPEVLRLLVPQMTPEEIALMTTERLEVYNTLDELSFDEEDKKRLEALHVVFYDPGVEGDILIKNGERQLHVTFLYNLSSKKVSDIEISQ